MTQKKRGCVIGGAAAAGCLTALAAVALIALVVVPAALTPDFAADGGVELVLNPQVTGMSDVDRQDMLQRTRQIELERVLEYGARGAEVILQDDGSLRVRLPGEHDTVRLEHLLTTRRRLELYRLSDLEPTAERLVSPPHGTLPLWFKRVDSMTGEELSSEAFLVLDQPFLGPEHLKDARVRPDQFNNPYVALTFTDEGKDRFCAVTTSSVQRKLPIVIDGMINSAPVVMEPICGGRASITLGDGTRQELEEQAQDLATALRSGPLPVEVVLAEARTISPSR